MKPSEILAGMLRVVLMLSLVLIAVACTGETGSSLPDRPVPTVGVALDSPVQTEEHRRWRKLTRTRACHQPYSRCWAAP
ncbi:MAG: hypothetical protein HC884_17950 [Chloroflexaceae bacterium]|nr:hypothetical protein [Chloroflexaceae bacterium]